MNLKYLDIHGNERTFQPSPFEEAAVKYGIAYIDDSYPYPCVRFYRDKVCRIKKKGETTETVQPVQYKDIQDVFELEGE